MDRAGSTIRDMNVAPAADPRMLETMKEKGTKEMNEALFFGDFLHHFWGEKMVNLDWHEWNKDMFLCQLNPFDLCNVAPVKWLL